MEETGKEIMVTNSVLSPIEMSADDMQNRLTTVGKQKDIFVKFISEQMKPKIHKYNIAEIEGRARKEGDKDVITKEGALLLASFYMCRPAFETVTFEHGNAGALSVIVNCKLYKIQTSMLAGEGEGLCTTDEEKYKWRWVKQDFVPRTIPIADCRSRKINTKYGELTLFRVPNDELGDLHNTILKMAQKRALVAAVLTLPFASEVFTQDLEEKITHAPAEKPADTTGVPENTVELLTEPQKKKVKGMFLSLGFSPELRDRYLNDALSANADNLTKHQASVLIDALINKPDQFKEALKTLTT